MLLPGERGQLVRITLCQILMSVTDIASLALLLFIIQYYTGSGKLPAWLPANLFQQGTPYPILLLLLLFLLKNIAAYWINRLQSGFVYSVATRLSRKGLQQYLDGSYTDYTDIDASVRIRQISHQPIEFSHYVLAGVMQLYTEAAMTTLAILAILLFNAGLFLVLLLILLPPVIITAYLTRKKLKAAREQVKHTSEKATQYLQEALNSYIESNIYHRKDFFINRYNSHQQLLNRHLSGLQVVQAIPARFMEVFAILGLLVLILVHQYTGSAASDLISIGAFMAAAYKIIPGISRMANTSAQMRLYAFSIPDPAPVKEATVPHYNAVRESVKTICFRDVSFAHGDRSILQDFNCAMDSGDFIGLTAASGKGKTTLINLLLGFLEPDKGTIAINDLPAAAAARQQYRSDMAYVKQQQFLIYDSIARNISLSDEAQDEERIQQAIRDTGLEPFIATFEEGMHKVVSDGGKNISGGQRQRIAIARALYKDAGLIILDEPFNELDQDSEQSLLQHFKELAAKGHIIILITHNRHSLSFCNKIIDLHA